MKPKSTIKILIIILILFTLTHHVSCDLLDNKTQNYGTDITDEKICKLISFVSDAQEYAIYSNSRAEALNMFNDKESRYFSENSFIFAFSSSGTILAHPLNQDLIGKPLESERDENGIFTGPIINGTVADGGGIFYSVFSNNSDAPNEQQLLAAYILPVDNEEWWLGSYIYLPLYDSCFDPNEMEKLKRCLHECAGKLITEKEPEITNFQQNQINISLSMPLIYGNSDAAYISLLNGKLQKEVFVDAYGEKIPQILSYMFNAGNESGILYYTDKESKKLMLLYAEPVNNSLWVGSSILASPCEKSGTTD